MTFFYFLQNIPYQTCQTSNNITLWSLCADYMVDMARNTDFDKVTFLESDLKIYLKPYIQRIFVNVHLIFQVGNTFIQLLLILK